MNEWKKKIHRLKNCEDEQRATGERITEKYKWKQSYFSCVDAIQASRKKLKRIVAPSPPSLQINTVHTVHFLSLAFAFVSAFALRLAPFFPLLCIFHSLTLLICRYNSHSSALYNALTFIHIKSVFLFAGLSFRFHFGFAVSGVCVCHPPCIFGYYSTKPNGRSWTEKKVYKLENNEQRLHSICMGKRATLKKVASNHVTNNNTHCVCMYYGILYRKEMNKRNNNRNERNFNERRPNNLQCMNYALLKHRYILHFPFSFGGFVIVHSSTVSCFLSVIRFLCS